MGRGRGRRGGGRIGFEPLFETWGMGQFRSSLLTVIAIVIKSDGIGCSVVRCITTCARYATLRNKTTIKTIG